MVGAIAAAWLFSAGGSVPVVQAACIDSRRMLSHAAYVEVAPRQCGQFLSTRRLVAQHRFART